MCQWRLFTHGNKLQQDNHGKLFLLLLFHDFTKYEKRWITADTRDKDTLMEMNGQHVIPVSVWVEGLLNLICPGKKRSVEVTKMSKILQLLLNYLY